MNGTEATTNIIVAMINNHFLCNANEISEAFKTIYKAVDKPTEE